jgi:hypothetical protein
VAEEWEYEADSASPPQVPRFPHRRRLLLQPQLPLHLPVMEFDAPTKYSKLVTNFCSASFQNWRQGQKISLLVRYGISPIRTRR